MGMASLLQGSGGWRSAEKNTIANLPAFSKSVEATSFLWASPKAETPLRKGRRGEGRAIFGVLPYETKGGQGGLRPWPGREAEITSANQPFGAS